jgi:hypothetical protein
VFPTPVSVGLSSATTGAQIHYTLDGSEPTQQSPQYSAPVTVSASAFLRARAFKDGLGASLLAGADFSIDKGASVATARPARPRLVSGHVGLRGGALTVDAFGVSRCAV